MPFRTAPANHHNFARRKRQWQLYKKPSGSSVPMVFSVFPVWAHKPAAQLAKSYDLTVFLSSTFLAATTSINLDDSPPLMPSS